MMITWKRTPKFFEKIEAKRKAPKETSQPADNHDAKIVVGPREGGKKGEENGPKKGSD